MRERIQQKIGRIKEYLSIIRSIKDECLKRFNDDPIYRGAMLHYLYLLSDSCIALAELIIRYKKLRVPQSYHEAFDILGDNGILEPEFSYEFARIAGFRNFLAHDYEKADSEFICEKILLKLDDVDTFLEKIETALK